MPLKTKDKKILESIFQMEGGWALDFTDRTMEDFFKDDLNIDIYDKKYEYRSGSKANRIRGFWLTETDEVISKMISTLIDYIETQVAFGSLSAEEFTENKISLAKKIAEGLLNVNAGTNNELEATASVEADFDLGVIQISLNENIFGHVKSLIKSEHYYNAVEESYKIVRERLRDITGKEKAHEAFSEENIIKIFVGDSSTEAEKDFREGVKFLHMSIQKLRNEKAHTPSKQLDKNLALHYIVLASLAYDLIK